MMPATELMPSARFCVIDETQQVVESHDVTDLFGDVRDNVMAIWTVVEFAKGSLHFGGKCPWSLKSLVLLWEYGTHNPSAHRSKRRNRVDTDALVKAWVPIIRGLSTAHTKDEVDRCEFESETYLAPLLTARVSQLREFFEKLCTALRNDPTIPLFVHSMFDAFHEAIVKRAPDAAVKELKTTLATEVAELVEKDVQPDIKAAIIGALQWRSPADLERVRDAVKGGAKPHLRGRESCLFLTVPDTDGKELTVML